MEDLGTVDLHVHSCYSFLDGASHPEELVLEAQRLGYTALALTDHNGLYGALEFAQAAMEAGIAPLTGAEVTLEDESHLTLLAETAEGYANLCRLLTLAHREGERRQPHLAYAELAPHAQGLIALSGCRLGQIPRLLMQGRRAEAERAASQLREWFGADHFFLELQLNLAHEDVPRCRSLAELGQALRIPLAATNNTHYHVKQRHPLQDTLVAIRHGVSLPDARRYRRPNREYALLKPEEWRERYREYPAALEQAARIAARCRAFNITQDLGYRFPDFVNEAEDGQFRTADEALALLCREALKVKYRDTPLEHRQKAEEWLKEELRLTRMHGLAGFFLVYRDLLQLSKEVAAEIRGTGPRGRFELPPGRGRGSAVSSIICYLIGLSPVDPVKSKLFPGRFLNESLQTVPDIDLDFPRDIREELIRRVHQRYGEDHVAMVNIMPTYRFRGAVREVGKALALPAAELDRLAKLGDGFTGVRKEMERLGEFSHYAENPLWGHLCDLSEQLRGMPRHVSQHCGGLVISSRPLIEIVPVEHSAMPGRQVCQWDKDSVDVARMIKIDFLALGMLSAVEECLELIVANGKEPRDLSRINYEDPIVYNRICRGETIGAFQIESRAQIGMLVRTQPRTMEDLAIEIAIVRPGPVVANAVNPYVLQREKQRASRKFKPTFDHPLLSEVLADTLGIIIYQDQTMEVCKALAGFTAGQADQLRRALSRKRSREHVERLRELFMEGAVKKDVPPEVAHRVFEKIAAFSAFGFPKSHAAAFAVLCFQSMWLLHYYPTEFLASLLNSQPMGFYGPDTLIKDAQRRGVRVLPPDLNESAPGCTVHGESVRLGLSLIKGVGKNHATALYTEREENGPFHSLSDVIRRARPSERVVESLILAGALDGFGLNRRELLWQLGLLLPQRGHQNIQRTEEGPRVVGYQPTLALPVEQDQIALPEASKWERMSHSYRLLALSVESHPIELLRPLLPGRTLTAARLRRCDDRAVVTMIGLVTTRQRPETARGILFLLLEDETGMVNVVVRPDIYETQRELFRAEPLLMVRGVLERRDLRLNLLALEAWPLTEFLPDAVKSAAARRAATAMREFTPPPSHNYR